MKRDFRLTAIGSRVYKISKVCIYQCRGKKGTSILPQLCSSFIPYPDYSKHFHVAAHQQTGSAAASLAQAKRTHMCEMCYSISRPTGITEYLYLYLLATQPKALVTSQGPCRSQISHMLGIGIWSWSWTGTGSHGILSALQCDLTCERTRHVCTRRFAW